MDPSYPGSSVWRGGNQMKNITNIQELSFGQRKGVVLAKGSRPPRMKTL